MRAAIACLSVLLAGSQAQAVAVAVTNAGFEDPPLADNAATDDARPGWTGSLGTLADNNFGAFDPPASFFPAGAPEGENVAYIQDGPIFQALSELLEPGTYTLTVAVGQSLVDIPSPFRVQLRANGTLLEEATSPVATAGEFAVVTVVYDAGPADPSLGELLEIVLVDDGQTALPAGLAAALQAEASATLQLLTSDAQCFEAALGSVKTADGVRFKAKAA